MSSIALSPRAHRLSAETRKALPLVAPISAYALGLAILAASSLSLGWQLLYALLFFGLATLAEAYPAPVGRIAGHTSLSMIAIVPAALILGWQYGTIIAVTSVLAVELVRRKAPMKAIYNGSMFAIAAAAAAVLGGHLHGTASVLLAATVYYAVNISLLISVIAVTRESVTGVAGRYLRTTFPQFLVIGSLTAMFVELWNDQPWLVALMVGPIAVIVIHQRITFGIVEKMRELDLEKDDFISYASHELRTPITVISGAAQTLRHRKLDPPAKAQFDELIYDNALRLSQMADQLLDMDRLGRAKVSPRVIQPADYLTDLVRRLGLAGQIEINANGETLVTDPDLLDRVVGNLVTNAVHYGAEPISVTAREHQFIVLDHGPGVPEEFRERMFKRFTRASLSANKHAKGAGLGLALAASYARVLGGTLTYEAAEPAGAKFTLSLPS
jgi:signal transduction histidine kinase